MRFTAPSGINFRTESEIPVSSLRQALEAFADFLKSRDQDGFLLRFDDWWQHNGEHMPKGKLSWEAFGDRYENESALVASMPKRDEVRVGICGPAMEWYLRYIADPDTGFGSVDLTVPAEWEEELREVADSLEGIRFISSPAEDYYRAIHSNATPVTAGRAASRSASILPDERFDTLAGGISFGGGFGWLFQGKVVAGVVAALVGLVAWLWLSEMYSRLH